MPYVIVSTVALLSNLYKNAPLIVGDRDSDPDLMRYLGARMTTNYPACGSPPMYVMHAPPRAVFDNLEKRGYCLMAAQTIQEHAVWVLARPRVAEDDKTEILRGGPNDKAVQATQEDDKKDDKKDIEKSKEVEKTKSETDKSKTDGTASEKSTKSAPHKPITAYLLKRIDKYTQSDIDLSASRGDHSQIISLLQKDNSNYEFGKRDDPVGSIRFPSKSYASLHGKEKLLSEERVGAVAKSYIKVGGGNEIPGGLLLLDGCTQTGYGDILWPPNIINLPKVILTEPSTTQPWKKGQTSSFTNLISGIQEETVDCAKSPCLAPASPLLEGNPIFASLEDRSHLGCLTQCEGCCCEE